MTHCNLFVSIVGLALAAPCVAQVSQSSTTTRARLTELVPSLPDTAQRSARTLLTATDTTAQIEAGRTLARLENHLPKLMPANPAIAEFFRLLPTATDLNA